MVSDAEITHLIDRAKTRFCLTNIGDPGGRHTAWASIENATLVADLIAVIEEFRSSTA